MQNRQLVDRRRELRLSQDALARKAGFSKRTIVRYEKGGVVRVDQRQPYAIALDWSLARLLLALSDEPGSMPNSHVVRRTFRLFASLEQGATALHTYQPVSLPGLLQTPEYASAVESVGPHPATAEEAARRVRHRLMRQKVLDRLRLHALIDHSVLVRDTGGPEVMAAQLDHLRQLCERPNVAVRVVPLDERAHAAGTGSFTLFTGEDEAAPYVVATENLGGPSYHEDSRLVDAYEELFAHLWRASDELAKVQL